MLSFDNNRYHCISRCGVTQLVITYLESKGPGNSRVLRVIVIEIGRDELLDALEPVFVMVFHESVLKRCSKLTNISFVIEQTIKRSTSQLISSYHRYEDELIIC